MTYPVLKVPLNPNQPTNLQARYDLFCVKSAVKPQPTNPTDYSCPRVTVAIAEDYCILLMSFLFLPFTDFWRP